MYSDGYPILEELEYIIFCFRKSLRRKIDELEKHKYAVGCGR